MLSTTQQLYIIITLQKFSSTLFRNTQHDHKFHHHNTIFSFSSAPSDITTSTGLHSSGSKTSSAPQSLNPEPNHQIPLLQTTLKLRRRRKRQLDGLCCLSPYCRALALCCPFPFNCLACSGLALSACPLSQKAKLQVLLQLTARSKQYFWVVGKAAAWFTLFGALAFAATYQLKVRRDERMYGIRRGPKDFIISSSSSSTSSSSLQLPSPWMMITGALFTIVFLVALVVYFRRRRRRRRKQTMIRTSCRTKRISRRRSSESKKRKRRGKEKAESAAAKHTTNTTTSKNNNVIMRRSNSN